VLHLSIAGRLCLPDGCEIACHVRGLRGHGIGMLGLQATYPPMGDQEPRHAAGMLVPMQEGER